MATKPNPLKRLPKGQRTHARRMKEIARKGIVVNKSQKVKRAPAKPAAE